MNKNYSFKIQSPHPSDIDTLGFTPYVNALFDFLMSYKKKESLTISIEGKWGQGKTSFLSQLSKRFVENGNRIIWFNPWRHDKESSIWSAFALELLKQLLPQNWYSQLCCSIKLVMYRTNKRVLKWSALIVLFFLIVLLMSALGKYERIFQLLCDFNIITEVTKVIVLNSIEVGSKVGFAISIIPLLYEFISKGIKPISIQFQSIIESPDYRSRINFVEEFHSDIKKIIKSVNKNNDSIFVFIDDLDRTAPGCTVELLQAINKMIDQKIPLIFLIAMDKQKVAAAFTSYNANLIPFLEYPDGESIKFGYNYIEKFINLTLHIPTPKKENIAHFINSFGIEPQYKSEQNSSKKNSNQSEEGKTINHKREEFKENQESRQQDIKNKKTKYPRLSNKEKAIKIKEVTQLTSELFDYNPRLIKEFYLTLSFWTYIGDHTEIFIEEPDIENVPMTIERMGKILAIQMKWPSLISSLKKEPWLLTLLQLKVLDIYDYSIAKKIDDTERNKLMIIFGLPFEFAPDFTLPEELILDSELSSLLSLGIDNKTIRDWAKQEQNERDYKGEKLKYSLAFVDPRTVLNISPVFHHQRTQDTIEKLFTPKVWTGKIEKEILSVLNKIEEPKRAFFAGKIQKIIEGHGRIEDYDFIRSLDTEVRYDILSWIVQSEVRNEDILIEILEYDKGLIYRTVFDNWEIFNESLLKLFFGLTLGDRFKLLEKKLGTEIINEIVESNTFTNDLNDLGPYPYIDDIEIVDIKNLQVSSIKVVFISELNITVGFYDKEGDISATPSFKASVNVEYSSSGFFVTRNYFDFGDYFSN